jgi:16S rRNA processing protein RimM
MSRVVIGTVGRAHGVRGLVRAVGSEALLDLRRLWIGGREYEVVHVTPERGDALLELRGLTDRDAAEKLRGQPIEALREELPPLEADELYVADLIGCAVFDVAGTHLGAVRATFPGGGHEVLEVAGGKHEFLLPLVDAIVKEVDVAARRIVCDPPEGLVNLDEADSDQ